MLAGMGAGMGTATALPLFHPSGDPPAPQTIDFIHIEPIASRAPLHDWTIRAHRHRHLFQLLLIEQGSGEMTYEAAITVFAAPCAILVPPAAAHGFRFRPGITDGWVISFTEDAAIGDGRGATFVRMPSFDPVVPLPADRTRLLALTAALSDEISLGRPGYRSAMRGLLTLIAVEVARMAAGRTDPLLATDATVVALRGLIEEHFQTERALAFYADKLAIDSDRLNDRVKRATGVTAGHLIRQRLLAEAKRRLALTNQPIGDIADALAFSDPSHFARFFRQQTGAAPHEFRAARGG